MHWGEIKYSYLDLKDYLAVLLNVSSMVFTLMGIWIAFIYPNALQRLINPDKIRNGDFNETLGDTKRLESLVGSVFRSAFVAIMIMLIYIVKTIFTNTITGYEHLDLIKAFLISFVILLTVLQLESVLYVIYSNLMFVNELHKKREDREADADI